MGQQQLLLIVLGVILVGVAVVLGIQYFSVGAEEGAKDELVAHSLTIGANAQEWYKKPVEMGGGGGSWTTSEGALVGFDSYFTTNLTKLHKTTNSATPLGYAVTVSGPNQLTIVATPRPNQGFTFTSVTTTITPSAMNTVIN